MSFSDVVDLLLTLFADSHVKLTTKAISKYASNINIEGKDLWDDEEQAGFETMPNAHAQLATVVLPLRVRMEILLQRKYTTLYILSIKTASEGVKSA